MHLVLSMAGLHHQGLEKWTNQDGNGWENNQKNRLGILLLFILRGDTPVFGMVCCSFPAGPGSSRRMMRKRVELPPRPTKQNHVIDIEVHSNKTIDTLM